MLQLLHTLVRGFYHARLSGDLSRRAAANLISCEVRFRISKRHPRALTGIELSFALGVWKTCEERVERLVKLRIRSLEICASLAVHPALRLRNERCDRQQEYQ